MKAVVFPTAWFGAELAEIRNGYTAAVFGCRPIGQFAIASARLMEADRILAAKRLEVARAQGAEVVDFAREDPVEVIRELTGGIGVGRVIEAVGINAEAPESPSTARDASPTRGPRATASSPAARPAKHSNGASPRSPRPGRSGSSASTRRAPPASRSAWR